MPDSSKSIKRVLQNQEVYCILLDLQYIQVTGLRPVVLHYRYAVNCGLCKFSTIVIICLFQISCVELVKNWSPAAISSRTNRGPEAKLSALTLIDQLAEVLEASCLHSKSS